MVVPGMVSFFLRVVLRETRELALQTHQNMADGMVGLSMQDSGYVPWTSRGRSTGGACVMRRPRYGVVSCRVHPAAPTTGARAHAGGAQAHPATRGGLVGAQLCGWGRRGIKVLACMRCESKLENGPGNNPQQVAAH